MKHLIGFIFILLSANALSSSYKIYLDADFSHHTESSESIERGIKVALATNDGKLWGKKIEVIRKDHRGNSARSERHINQFLKDPEALLMMSGIHSPPLLAHRDKINQSKVLFLVPWAAAGPITRYPSKDNFIFRLSVDDSKAGEVIVGYSIDQKKYIKPCLVLENTGWGKSNHKTMSSALKKRGVQNFKVQWFDWNLKMAGAKKIAQESIGFGCDVVYFVGNSVEGSEIIKAYGRIAKDKRIPVVSHWGIIGGKFHKVVPHDIRASVDLTFIQTSFSFMKRNFSKFESAVFNSAKELFPEIKTVADIQAPTGFIHSYDLGLLLIQASKQLKPSQNIAEVRVGLKNELENLNRPVRGLIKNYVKPFEAFDTSKNDAHEALGIGDFSMAKFGPSGEIFLIK